MHVLMINHSPKQSGVAVYVSNLYQQLNKMTGVRVDIADISDPSGLGFISGQAHKIKGSVEIANGLLRLPRGLDVYHATTQAISISRALVKPTVITIHDTASFLPTKDIVARVLFKIAFSFAKSAEMTICPSCFTRNEAVARLELNPNNVRVIPPGIDHTLFHRRNKEESRRELDLPVDARLIISVSTTLKHKNLPTLLRAFQMIEKKEPKARLIRIGAPDPTTPELNALARQLGIAHHIIHMKPSNQELAILYNASDIFLHTSTYEGFGFPLAEAMASGVPVITSNAASIPEVVGDAGIMKDPSDTEGFAVEALNIFDDQDRADKMSERGIQRSQQFSWEKCSEDTLRTYELASKRG